MSIDIDCPNEEELANMTYNECREIYNYLDLVKEKVIKVLNNLRNGILYNGAFLEVNFQAQT